MLELAWVVLFLVGLFVIEIWYVRSRDTSISAHVKSLNEKMDKQLIAGIFFLVGAIAGWMIAHFTTFC